MTKKLMFLACGSFSPPTPMHLRMFEIARDHYHERHKYEIIGGIVSPVHDSYSKNGLIAARHRCAMVRTALRTSDWIRMSEWECNEQSDWTRTRISLQYHQNYVNSMLNDDNARNNENLPEWLPTNIRDYRGENVQVKLLCGADLLESFAVPGLWNDEDLDAILGEHGIVVITRSGSSPEKFIFDSDLLTKYRKNITVITNWVPNEVSSTMARRHLSRGLSVKYMLDDAVVDYIRTNKLYGASDTTKYITSPNHQNKNTIVPKTATKLSNEAISNGRPKIFCCRSDEVSNLISRPGQAVQIRTETSSTRRIDHKDEVGERKVSTSTLSPEQRARQISKLSLGKLKNGTLGDTYHFNNKYREKFETLSAENLPTTSKRTPHDLIQFVFTAHGIKVISDKEYVV